VTPSAAEAESRRWIIDRLDPLAVDRPSTYPGGGDFGIAPGGPPGGSDSLKAAAVLFGLVERPAGLSVIFTRRADTLRSHTGQVALPGGRCDPGETPWAAALREAEEEIGLDRSHVTLAGLSTPYRTGTGYHVIPVVGFVTPPFALTANPDEVADIFETPFNFLMDLANHQPREGRSPAGDLRRFHAITWRDQMIWGATAGMVRALRERLYGPAPQNGPMPETDAAF
jgi:8-oxo-dGTP pyrophosphatase MutT (NUDIX family)